MARGPYTRRAPSKLQLMPLADMRVRPVMWQAPTSRGKVRVNENKPDARMSREGVAAARRSLSNESQKYFRGKELSLRKGRLHGVIDDHR